MLVFVSKRCSARCRRPTGIGAAGRTAERLKPMPGIGKGVEELRIREQSGAYRVIYMARRADAVCVLHAFKKKTQTASRRDIEIAKQRFSEVGGRGE